MAKYVIFGGAVDGYVHSESTNVSVWQSIYNYARAGGVNATLTVGVDAIRVGQKGSGVVGTPNNQYTFESDEGFVSFDGAAGLFSVYKGISAMLTMTVQSGRVDLTPVYDPSRTTSNVEISEYDWGTTVDTSDWVAGASTLVPTSGFAVGSYSIAPGATMQAMVKHTTNNNLWRYRLTDQDARLGIVPLWSDTNNSNDHRISFYSASAAGTANDPTLTIYTEVRSALTQVGNSLAQTSNGTWISLRSSGLDTDQVISLYYCTDRSTWNLIGVVPTGAGSSVFNTNTMHGHQVLSMCLDNKDNIYLTGFRGDDLSVCAKAYVKTVGSNVWTAKPLSISALAGGQGAAVESVWDPALDVVVASLLVPNNSLTGVNWIGSPSGRLLSAYARLSISTSSIRDGYSISGTYGTTLYGVDPPSGGGICSFLTPSGWAYRVATIANGFAPSFAPTNGTEVSLNPAMGGGSRTGDTKARAVLSGISTVEYMVNDSSGPYNNPGTMGTARIEAPSTFYDAAGLPAGAKAGLGLGWDAFYDPSENKIWLYWMNVRELHRSSFSLVTNVWGEDITVSNAVGPVGSSNSAVRCITSPYNVGLMVVEVANLAAGVNSVVAVTDGITHWPYSQTLTPLANFDKTVAQSLLWTFNDPNPRTLQGSYLLEIFTLDTDTSVVTTAKTASAVGSYALAANTLAADLAYKWRVTSWSDTDNVGPPSQWSTFYTSTRPVAVIIDPAVPNANSYNAYYDVFWTYSQIAGSPQGAYRLVTTRTSDGFVYSDTGLVYSSAGSARATGLVADVNATVTLTLTSTRGVSSTPVSQTIIPFEAPNQPLIQVSAVLGGVRIDITNPTPTGTRPPPVYNQLWSTNLGNGLHDSPDGDAHYLTEGAYTLLADHIPINTTVYDYGVVAGAAVGGPPKTESYFVRAVA